MTLLDSDEDSAEESMKDYLWPYNLNDFKNIEDYLDAASITTVRKPVGNPTFPPVVEIPADEVSKERDWVHPTKSRRNVTGSTRRSPEGT